MLQRLATMVLVLLQRVVVMVLVLQRWKNLEKDWVVPCTHTCTLEEPGWER